jgi:hypothetical protein
VREYLQAELAAFLRAVDAALDHPVETVVIGGAAAILHYGVPRATRDIDTWTTVREDLAVAVRRAREATGLNVPFEKSGVADAPYDFEDRLQRALPELERLTILVPGAHEGPSCRRTRLRRHRCHP